MYCCFLEPNERCHIRFKKRPVSQSGNRQQRTERTNTRGLKLCPLLLWSPVPLHACHNRGVWAFHNRFAHVIDSLRASVYGQDAWPSEQNKLLHIEPWICPLDSHFEQLCRLARRSFLQPLATTAAGGYVFHTLPLPCPSGIPSLTLTNFAEVSSVTVSRLTHS